MTFLIYLVIENKKKTSQSIKIGPLTNLQKIIFLHPKFDFLTLSRNAIYCMVLI